MIAVVAVACGAGVPGVASASPLDPGGVIKIVKRAREAFNANQSGNWFGYGEGSLERGGKLFTSISATWKVPTARQHQRGAAADSATWLGIGGGCVDAGCLITDSTLIQTGTEQDVAASGKAHYSAWWEIVPLPAMTISQMSVRAGDKMRASIVQTLPEVWRITLSDLSRHQSFSTTVPYTSSYATAEWIEETPITIGSGGAGLASLPRLSETPFDNATVDGKPAALKPSEKIDLTNGSRVVGVPSSPDRTADGFGACAWTTRCPVPHS